jgi:predicted HNH restriction endonuclease
MPSAIPQGYSGAPLSESVLSLLEIVQRYGFQAVASSRHTGATINLLHNGERCGYINSTVLRHGSVLGYHFSGKWSGRPNNACPPEISDRILAVFSDKYRCSQDELEIHHGTGSKNVGRTFLHIRDPILALRILLQDIGKAFDESIVISRIGNRYIEGALRDVKMQSYERSSQARAACLSHYGFSCFVCGINLRLRYVGLPTEVIHVHHEEPLASSSGPRETNPIDDLKPVCPNCHAVIHSRTPPYSIQDVQQMLRET